MPIADLLEYRVQDQYFTPADLASRLGIAPQTLANWRSQGKGPAFTRIGGRIRYTSAEVERYLSVSCSHLSEEAMATKQYSGSATDEKFRTFLDGLSRRAQTAIKNSEITSLRQLNKMTTGDFRRIPNCGTRTIEEIRTAMHRRRGVATLEVSLRDELARLVKIYGLRSVLVTLAQFVSA